MLELKNIAVCYGQKPVLTDISLPFPQSRLTAVIGPNGSGKSTLLKAAMALLPTAAGEINLDGQAISRLSRQALALKAAYLPQGKTVPDMTVGQLVLHGRFPHVRYPRRYTAKDKQVVVSALDTLRIAELSSRPLGSLSGGMRQNAYIAMALAQDTDYILLDEPTTYLDIAHQLELMRTLRKLASLGKGVVAVLHDLPLAFAFSDSIVVLRDGELILQGDPQEVYRHPAIQEVFGVRLEYDRKEQSYRYRF